MNRPDVPGARFVGEGLTFDDVLLVPRRSAVLPGATELRSRLTNRIELAIPLLSAAMDTVTESRMAITMAREGGIGIIHKNMSIDRQAEEVDRVKRSESGLIADPVTIRPHQSLGDVLQQMERVSYSGFPVVEEDGRLVGLVTESDVLGRLVEGRASLQSKVAEVMFRNVRTVEESDDVGLLSKIFNEGLVAVVVGEDRALKGIVTKLDLVDFLTRSNS